MLEIAVPARAARPRAGVRWTCALLFLLFAAAPTHAAPASRRSQALASYHHAEVMLARRTIEGRRMAIQDLELATQLDPGNAEYELLLARTYYQAGFLGESRHRYERVVRMSPADANGRYGLGTVWRRDWLKYLEKSSLDRSIEQLQLCCRLRSDHTDAWLTLTPLLVERGDLAGATNAAQRALVSNPRRADALLAYAYTAYRNGDLMRADSAFAVAIPRLPRSVRERFDDISPVATERDTFTLHRLPAGEQPGYVRRFWKDLDPDLTTSVNEALLEYQSRVAHAYFLYYNPKLREWDERGEVYVRYGAPAYAAYNPTRELGDGAFPANVLLWRYPELQMNVTMIDRTMNEFYGLETTIDFDPDPVPDPEVLASLGGSLAARSGRGVFPVLPPGVDSISVRGVVAVFPGDPRPQIRAQIEAPGAPIDSLWADWTVLDSTMNEVERGRSTLAPSACDPTTRRVADFAAPLAPGTYHVGLTVRDRAHRRGVYRDEIVVPPWHNRLALSDVLVSCGAPFVGPDGDIAGGLSVRPEPNPAARVGPGDPLTAYFEITNLAPDRDGLARFEYVYTVKSAEKDPRIWLQRAISPRHTPDPIIARREEEQPGSLRRQFVSVPVQSLPTGKYVLDITVRDLVDGAEATTSALFWKVPSTP